MLDSPPERTSTHSLLNSERWWLAAFFLLIPLKLSFAYGALFPALALWYGKKLRRLPLPIDGTRLAQPLALFFCIASLSCLFAFAPLHSLVKNIELLFFLAIIPLLYKETTRETLPLFLFGLISGQTLAALVTLFESNIPGLEVGFFHGAVTESGQLALTIPLTLGALFALRNKLSHHSSYLFGGAVFVLLGAGFMFPAHPIRLFSIAIGLALIGYFFFIALTHAKHNRAFSAHFALATIVLPLLCLALLYNLKRGPWLGVACASSIFLFLYARRVLIPVLTIIALTVLLSDPVQQRILSSMDHFFIPGGRSEIWSIGWDLALRFPLGIGFDNSSVLSSFSTKVPHELEHFHSNPINILVETGWVGLGLYLYWIGTCLSAGFSKLGSNTPRAKLCTATACAFLSWQISGLVEYNFGDSEVFLLALGVVGVLGALAEPTSNIEADEALV